MKIIEEVKEYFKNAKEVRCLQDDAIYDLTNKVTGSIHVFNAGFWIEINSVDVLLYQYEKFAEIISYKDNKPEFEHLEEIEVSSSEDFTDFETVLFGCNRPKTQHGWDYICFYKDKDSSVGIWKYVRKINHERNEAIQAIKELMKSQSITKDEI